VFLHEKAPKGRMFVQEISNSWKGDISKLLTIADNTNTIIHLSILKGENRICVQHNLFIAIKRFHESAVEKLFY
jgi:hypothetical protein